MIKFGNGVSILYLPEEHIQYIFRERRVVADKVDPTFF